MLKKDITYTNFDGNQVTETFYFNLTKAEIVEMQVSEPLGLAETLQALVAERDGAKIIEHFKRIILQSYGEKTADGKRFVKTAEARDAFASTEAYSELFMELATNADAASQFVNGIMPAGLLEETQNLPKLAVETRTLPKNPQDMSKEELLAMLEEKS